jgi:hypothetical protein
MIRIVSKALRVLLSQRFAMLAILVVGGLLFAASGARAGCSVPNGKAGTTPRLPFVSQQGPEDSDQAPSIVGMWHLIYTATSASGPFPPTPFEFLESYKTWHADGTEFENAFLPPVGGNICFGVWKKLKSGSFKLHHIGLTFDATTGKISNIFTVDEIDTVADDGKTYTGTFDFKLFPPADVYGTGTPLAEVTGTTAGTRISVPRT